ncbi:uncharacterized protein LOC144357722 [Saccoglossus kowalevskii]
MVEDMHDLFDDEDYQKVKCKTTCIDQARECIDILLTKGPTAFHTFVSVCRVHCKWVADVLLNEEEQAGKSTEVDSSLPRGMQELSLSNKEATDLFEEYEFIEKIEELADFTVAHYDRIVEKLKFTEEQKSQLAQIPDNRKVLRFLQFWRDTNPRPEACNLVRCLEKTVKRDDVSDMLREFLPAGTAGPRLGRHMKIQDMKMCDRNGLATALSSGSDWKIVAEAVGIGNNLIKLWDIRRQVPMEDVLRTWEPHTDATIGKLYEILVANNMAQYTHYL